MAEHYTDADVELIGAQLAIHPVLSLLALQEDAPEAEAQIRDCAEKIVSALAAAGRLTPADAETRTEWASDHMHRTYADPVLFPVGANRDLAETRIRWHTEHGRPSRLLSRTIVVGPWLPVPTEEDTRG